jgi:hypothetical protein
VSERINDHTHTAQDPTISAAAKQSVKTGEEKSGHQKDEHAHDVMADEELKVVGAEVFARQNQINRLRSVRTASTIHPSHVTPQRPSANGKPTTKAACACSLAT